MFLNLQRSNVFNSYFNFVILKKCFFFKTYECLKCFGACVFEYLMQSFWGTVNPTKLLPSLFPYITYPNSCEGGQRGQHVYVSEMSIMSFSNLPITYTCMWIFFVENQHEKLNVNNTIFQYKPSQIHNFYLSLFLSRDD